MGYIFLLLALWSCQLFGQTDFSGKLLDDFGRPIANAYLFNKSSKTYFYSDDLGNFTLEYLKQGDSVEVGAFGYKKEIIQVDSGISKKDMPIILQEDALQLKEVVIRPNLNTLNEVVNLDLEKSPVRSSQEILRKVPGLFIGQHAGGGKAEQLFLRGFDLDHGTDISINVDGVPVNMVSHAHGQGYADLHFLIPETISKVSFGKGPYNSEKGNFSTAGNVDFKTKNSLDENVATIQFGSFGQKRGLGMFNVLDTDKKKAYVASEIIASEGYFDSPQDFERFNIFGKYNHSFSDMSRFSVTLSHFKSSWTASGQIPNRAVESGQIGRFGSIDDTEGGETSRSTIQMEFHKEFGDDSSLKVAGFAGNYQFELFSNFTFFLNDPVNGDQIKQEENRFFSGLNLNFSKILHWGDDVVTLKSGIGLRHDRINDNGLFRTRDRNTILQNVQLGDVSESNWQAFSSAQWKNEAWLLNLGIRWDRFHFGYDDQLSTIKSNTVATVVSPKLSLIFTPNQLVQWYLKSGVGFHSNDTRVILQNREDGLPKAYGVDVGTIWKPKQGFLFNMALWSLFSEQEFVYVGDEGIVEPSGRSTRYGVDLGMRYELNKSFFAYTDATYSHARSSDAEEGADYIPLAPNFTWTGGVGFSDIKGFSGGLNYRFLGNRPANEDFSISAEGYWITDLSLQYAFNKNISLNLAVENLFNLAWEEAQFATTSQLEGETVPVEEIHFTPGTPFSIRTGLKYVF